MQSGIFTLAGVIVGAILTYFFARASQHAQWLRDNRKQECRELLTAVSAASAALGIWYSALDDLSRKITFLGEIETLKNNYVEANIVLQTILTDRLFIATEVREANIRDSWTMLVNENATSPDYQKLKKRTEELSDTIRRIVIR